MFINFDFWIFSFSDFSVCDYFDGEGYFAHSDPKKYIHCINGNTKEIDCPSGKEYDDDLETCILIDFWTDYDTIEKIYLTDDENIAWNGSYDEDEEEDLIGSIIMPEIDPVIEAIDIATVCLKGGQFYSHSDPTKYIQCANGWPFIKDCPRGQIWIDRMQWCDFGSVPTVTGSNTTPTTSIITSDPSI
jgi:hypothetical protein